MTIEQVAMTLLVWISTHSSYQMAAKLPPPPIVSMSSQELATLVRNRAGPEGQESLASWMVHGYYSTDGPDRGTIYIVHPSETPGAELFSDAAENPIWRERLLHELVHHAQHVSGAQFECSQKRELSAYYLGGVYLQQRAVADPLPDRILIAFWASRC